MMRMRIFELLKPDDYGLKLPGISTLTLFSLFIRLWCFTFFIFGNFEFHCSARRAWLNDDITDERAADDDDDDGEMGKPPARQRQ